MTIKSVYSDILNKSTGALYNWETIYSWIPIESAVATSTPITISASSVGFTIALYATIYKTSRINKLTFIVRLSSVPTTYNPAIRLAEASAYIDMNFPRSPAFGDWYSTSDTLDISYFDNDSLLNIALSFRGGTPAWGCKGFVLFGSE